MGREKDKDKTASFPKKAGMKMAKNILVTGGGGFLGFAIVRQLTARGDRVTTISRSLHPELSALGVKQIQADISTPEKIGAACKDMDVVIHTAAKPGVWGKFDDYYRPNVLGTKNVAAACKKHRVPVLVHTSSPSVIFDGADMEGINESYPYPSRFATPYTKTKAEAEQLVRAEAESGAICAVILRPHLIWGPGDPHLVPRVIARAKKLVKVGSKDNLVDTIYIDDAANAHVLAADRLAENPGLSGRVYFISQDQPIPMYEMLNGILAAAGLPPVTKTLPAGVVWCVGALLEAGYKTLGIQAEPPMTRFVAKELATAHWFDIRAAKKDLGYRPGITIEEGLKRLAEWLGR